MRKNLLCTFALLSSIFFSGISRAQSAPTISYTTPVNGSVGTSIKIVGNNFGSTQSSSTIAFNGTTATPTSWSNTQIVAPVPTGATTGPIVVTVGGVASNHVNFTVGTPPTISYTNPVSGPVGTSVTIVGTYFGSTQGSSTLTFNGTLATPTSWSSTQIVTPVPSGATTGPVIVTVGGVTSNHVNFTVGTPPTISYTNPIDGPSGTTVTIAGNYFGSTQGSSTITFNGTPATPASWSNTQIVTAVPTGAATGPVLVTVGSLASNHVNFIVGTPPTISYTNPIDGPVSTSITIVGNYFGSTIGNVTFNGTAATPTSWSNTQIVVPIPNGASTGPVVVTAGGMASNSVNFIVGTPPTISYTNPVRAAVGSSITIVGNYFGSTQGSSTITFNGTAAAPSSWGNTQVTVPIPAGSSTGPLIIAVGGMNSNSVSFTVVPNIISLSPSTGPSGTSVTIAGTTFGLAQGSSAVTFNGTVASPSSWSDSQITVPVPSGASTGPVVVTAVGNASNSANFTFLPTPSITSVSPASGSVGASVTITGTNFGPSQGSSTVTFNGTAATPPSWSPTSIVVPVPTGATTGNVVITESGVASNGARFTVASGTQPTITASASPAPNVNGWNNSNVTVTFTCTAGTASITNCPSPQTITTEGANQVISGTATDANGLTATASVTLNIDKTIPVLAVTSPADGTSFSTAAVTISGTVSDALSGLSTVTCNGTAATAASGSFSCNISLNVGVNLVVVRATDVAGNVAGSNFHLSLAGTLPTPQVLQITPTKVSMLVGDTQTFTAVDELGRPRPDATWTISDITLATISTDSAPVLTAVGIGEPTLTANVQGTSAQIQVNILGGTSLTPGTYRWAAAPVAGFALYEMLQAAPASASTPDLYSIETGAGNSVLIRAFTGDGQQMWQQTLGNFSFSALPDAFGGLLVDTSAGRIDLDGASGMPVWQSPASGSTIRQDGTIVTTTNTNLSMFDGNTGQKVLDITPPRQSTFARIFTYGLPTDSGVGGPDNTGTPTVGPDGSIYLLYTTSDYTDVQSRTIVFGEPFFTDVITTIYSLNLLTVSPDGSIHTQQVGPSTTNVLPVPGYAIPDGNGGVLASWSNLPSWPFHVADVSTNGTSTYDLPLSGIFLSGGGTVVGTNGMAFATDSTNTVAFTASSGQTFWNIPGSIAEVTLGNGMSLFDAQGDIVQVDSQGVAGMPVPCATCLAAFNLNLYTTFTGPAGLVVGPSQILEVSESPLPQGNRQNQNVTPTPSFAHFITRNPGDPPSSFTTAQAVNDIKTFLSGTNTKNSFYTGGEGRTAASINNFLSVLKGGNSGLGFIGDSALASGGAGFPFSIGLCFFPSEPTDPPSIPPNCLVRTPDDLNSNPLLHYGNILQANPTWRTADKLPVNLRIVFIGSCEDADVFNQWWQIDNSTTGHVLVVPSSPTAPTNLVSAIAEWEDIVKYMAGTMNAGEAITKANQVLANQNSPGAWKPIGDPHVCISTACKKATHTN